MVAISPPDWPMISSVPSQGIESLFDEIARQAAMRCDAAFAAVTLAVGSQGVVVARIGLKGQEAEGAMAVAAYAMLAPDPLVVEDLRKDVRFAGLPFVVDVPLVRSYAGVPIRSPQGTPLGTVGALDGAPRAFDADVLSALRPLAALAGELLEARRIVVERLGTYPHPEAYRRVLAELGRLLEPLFESLSVHRPEP